MKTTLKSRALKAITYFLCIVPLMGCIGTRDTDLETIKEKVRKVSQQVKETGKPVTMDLDELFPVNWQRLCFLGPHCSAAQINGAIEFNWAGAEKWEKTVCNNEELFSVLVVNGQSVTPVYMDRKTIDSGIASGTCISYRDDLDVTIKIDDSKRSGNGENGTVFQLTTH